MTNRTKIIASVSALALGFGALWFVLRDGPPSAHIKNNRNTAPVLVGEAASMGECPACADATRVQALVATLPTTATAAQTGVWSNPATWGGTVPIAGSTVVIPAGVTVTLDTATNLLAWLRVDGGFTTDPTQPTTLLADLVVVNSGATWSVDVSQNVGSFNLIFAGTTINTSNSTVPYYDPYVLGEGFHALAPINMIGRTITPWSYSLGNNAGDTTITLTAAETGWRVGDTLLLPGTSPSVNDDDIATISGIDPTATIITVSAPLKTNHRQGLVSGQGFTELPPPNGLATGWSRPAIVANISKRSIDFSSANQAIGNRGHVMLMNSNADVWHYCSFTNLGRTNKALTVTDPDGTGSAASVANPRARYAFHFHTNGGTLAGNPGGTTPADITGCVVNGTPGWGFVNHGSYVNFTSCVATNFYGCGFLGENGEEIGTFQGCLAARSSHPYFSVTSSSDSSSNAVGPSPSDFFKMGDGFGWMAGGVVLQNCVATGIPCQAYLALGTQFYVADSGLNVAALFSTSNLPPPYTYSSPTFVANLVPQNHSGLVAFGVSGVGFGTWSLNGNNATSAQIGVSTLSNSYFEAGVVGVMAGYESFVNTTGVVCVANVAINKSGTAFDNSGGFVSGNYTNCTAIGFQQGWVSQTGGVNTASGCTHQCGLGYNVNNPNRSPRSLTLTNLTAIALTPAQQTAMVSMGKSSQFVAIQGSKQQDILYTANMVGTSFYSTDFFRFFQNSPSENYIGYGQDLVTLNGTTLFSQELLPSFALSQTYCKTAPVLANLTTAQVAAAPYNMPLGAFVTPNDLTPATQANLPGNNVLALVSPSGGQLQYLQQLTINANGQSFIQTTAQTGFVATIKNAAGQNVSSVPQNTVAGWGVLQFVNPNGDGVNRGVLYYVP